MEKKFDLNKFKKQASKVSDFLAQKEASVPKETLLNALSIFVGEKNWNTLRALLSEPKNNKLEKNEIDHYDIAKKLYMAIFNGFLPFKKIENLKQIKYNKEKIEDLSKFTGTEEAQTSHAECDKNRYLKINKSEMIGDEYIFEFSLDFIKEKMSVEDRNLIKYILLNIIFSDDIDDNPVKENIVAKPYITTKGSVKRERFVVYIAVDKNSLSSELIERIEESFLMGVAAASSSSCYKNEKTENENYSKIRNNIDYFKEKGLTININVHQCC